MADKDDIITHYSAGTLLELFVERTRRHRSDDIGKAFRSTLTKLHNDGAIDVLEPARAISSSSINQHDFFTVMHVYCDLIPTLKAEVLPMLAAVKALVAHAGNDGASGEEHIHHVPGRKRRVREQRARMTQKHKLHRASLLSSRLRCVVPRFRASKKFLLKKFFFINK